MRMLFSASNIPSFVYFSLLAPNIVILAFTSLSPAALGVFYCLKLAFARSNPSYKPIESSTGAFLSPTTPNNHGCAASGPCALEEPHPLDYHKAPRLPSFFRLAGYLEDSGYDLLNFILHARKILALLNRSQPCFCLFLSLYTLQMVRLTSSSSLHRS